MYMYLRICVNIIFWFIFLFIRCLVDNLMCKLFSFNNILLLLYCRFKFEVLDKMEFMNKIEFEMILCMLNIIYKNIYFLVKS